MRDIVLTDICPFSLSIEVNNEEPPYFSLASFHIRRNTILPASGTRLYSTVRPGQKKLDIAVFQGENVYAKDNAKLANLEVRIPMNRKECESVRVSFIYDINAILVVEVEVLSTGKVSRLVYTGNGWKDDKRALDKIDRVKLAIETSAHKLESEYVVDRALRVASESDESTRLYVTELLSQYARIVESNNLRNITEKTKEFSGILDVIEGLKGSDGIFWKQDS